MCALPRWAPSRLGWAGVRRPWPGQAALMAGQRPPIAPGLAPRTGGRYPDRYTPGAGWIVSWDGASRSHVDAWPFPRPRCMTRADGSCSPGSIAARSRFITESSQHPGLLRDKRAAPTYTNINYCLPVDKIKGQADKDAYRRPTPCVGAAQTMTHQQSDETPVGKSATGLHSVPVSVMPVFLVP